MTKNSTKSSRETVVEFEKNTLESSRLVAYAISSARKKSGLTQKELSEKTGIAQGDISRLENGLSNPSFSTIVRIAEAMGMEVQICLSAKN